MTNDDEHLEMIADCEARESRLTEWEAGFIDSVRNQIEDGRSLSQKQGSTLCKIWEATTERG